MATPFGQNQIEKVAQQLNPVRPVASNPTISSRLENLPAPKTILKSQAGPMTQVQPTFTIQESPSNPLKSVEAGKNISAMTNMTAPITETPASLSTPSYDPDMKDTLTDYKSVIKSVQDKLSSFSPIDQQAEMEKIYETYGVTDALGELKNLTNATLSLRQELDKVTAEEREAIKLEKQNAGADIGFLDNRVKRISSKYDEQKTKLNASIASYASQSAMLQNNITLARSLAADMVNAATYDNETEYKRLTDFLELNQGEYNDLDQSYKDVVDEAVRKQENAYNQAISDRKAIASWATDPNTAGALLGYDLSKIDFNEATTLVNQWTAKRAPVEQVEQAVVVPKSTTGANYNTRLNQVLDEMYSGRYGTQGAREKAINILLNEFPTMTGKVEKDVYAQAPDNWEANAKSSNRMTSTTVDTQTMSDLVYDIKAGATLEQLYGAYTEVSPSLIQSVYYNR